MVTQSGPRTPGRRHSSSVLHTVPLRVEELVQTVETDDGALLWHVVCGTGPPLVLCHGGPGLWDNLGSLASLVDGVAEVHRWDQRGGGRSSRTGPYTVTRMIEDMEVIRRHAGVEQWMVLGHSWGAELALHYATAHPDRTAGLLYLSGRGLMDSWRDVNRAACSEREARRTTRAQRDRLDVLAGLPHRNPALEREFRLLSWHADISPGFDAEVLLQPDLDAPYEINFDANRALGEDNRAAADRLRGALPLLTVRTLLIHGSNDPRPAEGAAEIARLLPNSTVEVVEAGHLPWLETPHTIQLLLVEFIRTATSR